MNSNSEVQTSNTVNLHVQQVICSAEHELLSLLQQRQELMKRIGSIKQTLTGLANMFGDSMFSDQLLTILDRKSVRQSGFTQACRAVLMELSMPLSARQVCDQLRRKFPGTLERHKKPFASVTTVLTRLVEYDEARTFLSENGLRVWEWVSEPRPDVLPDIHQTIDLSRLSS
jgi:hypothetical protein